MSLPITFSANAASYVAAVRLPAALAQKLEAEGASDMSISLSDGTLSVGGESFSLSAVPEDGHFDVVRQHANMLCSVGAVRERISVKQTLGNDQRAQIKQRTEQAQRDVHGHQTVSMESAPPAAKRAKVTPPKQATRPSKQHELPPQQQRAKGTNRPVSSLTPPVASSSRHKADGSSTASASRPAQARAGGTNGLAELQSWCVQRAAPAVPRLPCQGPIAPHPRP
jgi:hypothetical protein